MTERDTALGLFERKSDAKAALRRLREGGFRMSAGIYCTQAGKITVDGYAGNPLLSALAGAAFLALAAALFELIGLSRVSAAGPVLAGIVFAVCLAAGAAIGAIFTLVARFRKYGLEI